MNTKSIGEASEAMVIAALLRNRKVILQPFGDNQRYDLVIDEGGKFLRVQVKTGRIRDGAIIADTASTYAHRGGVRRGYRGQVELFAIYCPENDEAYLVPIDQAPGTSITLRLEPPKNGQATNVRWAKDFVLSGSTIGRAASC